MRAKAAPSATTASVHTRPIYANAALFFLAAATSFQNCRHGLALTQLGASGTLGGVPPPPVELTLYDRPMQCDESARPACTGVDGAIAVGESHRVRATIRRSRGRDGAAELARCLKLRRTSGAVGQLSIDLPLMPHYTGQRIEA